MDFARLHTTTKAAIGLAALYLVYYAYTALDLWSRRRALKREKGVLDAPKWPQKDPIYGLDLFFENIAALKSHTILELGHRRFGEIKANTFQLTALGRHMHVTTE